MSKITALFKELKATGKKGLIPFITAGDPDPKQTVELMHALVRGGSSVIELGVPFSDPMADGPVIQRSSERALTQGVTLYSCLEMVKEFRKLDVDGNNLLSFDEWAVRSINKFKAADKAGKGYLTREEFAGTKAKAKPKVAKCACK